VVHSPTDSSAFNPQKQLRQQTRSTGGRPPDRERA
jgi:hypothetical protein